MRGHGHDRTGAVLDKNVVGDPNRDLLVRHRIEHAPAGIDARLGAIVAHAVGDRLSTATAHVIRHRGLGLGATHEVVDHRVLGRKHEERGPEQRVGTRREDGDRLVAADDGELHLGAMRAADPVALHREHALGPLLELLHVVEQTIGVVGDTEEPLLEIARLDFGTAALAVPVDDLLVRQHGLILRAPLDGGTTLVRKAALEHAQEDPLRPLVVLGIRRRQLTAPVDRPAHAQHLLANARDVAGGHLGGLTTGLDRRVLGGQAERVVAHRVQHLVPSAAAKVRDNVAHRVIGDVPHVEVAGGVRQHLKHVGARRIVMPRLCRIGRLERLLVGPHLLPAGLDGLGVVALHTGRIRIRSAGPTHHVREHAVRWRRTAASLLPNEHVCTRLDRSRDLVYATCRLNLHAMAAGVSRHG